MARLEDGQVDPLVLQSGGPARLDVSQTHKPESDLDAPEQKTRREGRLITRNRFDARLGDRGWDIS